MAGIYIHIPFCKQACSYCDFHFSTNTTYHLRMVDSIISELQSRKNYLNGKEVSTIYFGGGTPSQVGIDHIKAILDVVSGNYPLSDEPEITLEANPDDLSTEYLDTLKTTEVNRLSIGIQSFRDKDLVMMNRAHSSEEARQSVENSKSAGFENITIDLIYGISGMKEEDWLLNLEEVFKLRIPHISTYGLTIEEGTVLHHQTKKGIYKPIEEELGARHYQILVEQMRNHGYEQYEISNFALPGMLSRHNSNYWRGEHYLGVGPSAHSFNGDTRSWNVSNNMKYMGAIENGEGVDTEEKLGARDKYNEYILTSLRTSWGCDSDFIRKSFGAETECHFLERVSDYSRSGMVKCEDNIIILTDNGKLIADRISSDLFL